MSKTKSDIDRRRRRRRRRFQIIIIYAAIALALAWFFESQATTTVILVRHAEKSAEPGTDPGLSMAGKARAVELARQLVDADVIGGVDAIYSTPYRRTVETARPLADALGLTVISYEAANTETIMDDVIREHKGDVIVMVGHSNTVPALIYNMGASKNVPPIAEDEYDNLYLVTIPWFGKTKTIRLRYGVPHVATP